jgi:hypothetical protein
LNPQGRELRWTWPTKGKLRRFKTSGGCLARSGPLVPAPRNLATEALLASRCLAQSQGLWDHQSKSTPSKSISKRSQLPT